MNQKHSPEAGIAVSGASEYTAGSRRQLLKTLGGAAIALPALMTYPGALLSAATATSASANPGFRTFLSFSAQVTGYRALDSATAQQIYTLLETEPWGLNHLQRIEKKLSPQATLQTLTALDKGEHWFFGHLLTTWITGIYYHSSGNVMVSYEHALMHDALKDIRPVPGMSVREFGFWSQAPETGAA